MNYSWMGNKMRMAITGNSIQIDSTYEERLQCKELGAFWDAEKKRWYMVIIKKTGERSIRDEQIKKIREFGFDPIADHIERLVSAKPQTAITEKARQELLTTNKNKYDLPEHPLLKIGLAKLKIKLLDFQKEDVNFALHRLDRANSFCNFSQMGTGKSAQSLAISLTNEIKTLIVCPAFLKRNWEKEIQKFTNEKCFVVRNKKDLLKEKEIAEVKYVIINYEILEACQHLFKDKLVISDESVALKNEDSKRTKHFFNFIPSAKKVIYLTGTPMKKGVPDAFTIFSYCCPIFPKKYWDFCKRYSIEKEKKIGRNKTAKIFVGINKENLQEFLMAQDTFSVRRKTKEVVRLPEMSEITHWVEAEPLSNFVGADITDETDALINFIKNGGYSGATEELKKKMSQWKKANALSKAKACAEYAINSIEEENPKLIIFSDHPDACAIITDKLRESGELNVAMIIGNTPMDDRSKYVTEFQTGVLNVIVATIGSMATGVTLTAANLLIFNDSNWSPDQNEQAQARIYRIGQERNCTTVYIVGTELDEIITRTVNRKNRDIKTALKNY